MPKVPTTKESSRQSFQNPTGLPSGNVSSPLVGLGRGVNNFSSNMEKIEKAKKSAERILEVDRGKGLIQNKLLNIQNGIEKGEHGKSVPSEYITEGIDTFYDDMKKDFDPNFYRELDNVKQSLLNTQLAKTMNFENKERTKRIKVGIQRIYNNTVKDISEDPDNLAALMKDGSELSGQMLTVLGVTKDKAFDRIKGKQQEWAMEAIRAYTFKGDRASAFGVLKRYGSLFGDPTSVKETIRSGFLKHQKFVDGQVDRKIKRKEDFDKAASTSKAEDILKEKALAGNNVVALMIAEDKEDAAIASGVLSPGDWKKTRKASKPVQDRIDLTLIQHMSQARMNGDSVSSMREYLSNSAVKALYSREVRTKLTTELAAHHKALQRSSAALIGSAERFITKNVVTAPNGRIFAAKRRKQEQLASRMVMDLNEKISIGSEKTNLRLLALDVMAKYGKKFSQAKMDIVQGNEALSQSTIPTIKVAVQKRVKQIKQIDKEVQSTLISNKRRSLLNSKREELLNQVVQLDEKSKALQLEIEHKEERANEERNEDVLDAANKTLEDLNLKKERR